MTDRIARASLFLASGTIVSRILGFLKAIVLAATIGVVGSASADAFAVANGLPNTVYVIVAGGVLSAVLVPQIVRAATHEDGGSAYINKLVTLALVVIGAATVLATALAPLLAWIYGGNFPPETLALATAFAFWCLPQIFFYGLYTLLGEVLNARRSFGPFTWVPVLNNVVALVGLVAFGLLFGFDPTGSRTAEDWTPGMVALLAGTATLGIVAQAVVLFWFWRRIGLRYRLDFHWRGVGLRSAGRMAGWTFGMLLLTTLAGIVQTRVVSEASGYGASVAATDAAWLIFMLPHSVITVSIATAYFTRMSEHARDGKLERVRHDLSGAVRGVGLILTLASAVLIVVAYPFAAVFQPGDFGSVSALGNVIIAFAIGLVAFSVLFVVQRTFYALGDTRTPFLFTLVQVVLFSLAALACLLFLPREWIAVGVALATTVAGVIQLGLAVALLRPKLGTLDGRHVVTSLGRDLVAVILPIAAGVAIAWAFGAFRDGGFAVADRWSAILVMAIVGVVMAAMYGAILWLLRSPELRGFVGPALARLRRG
ncbi:putative peptidoglycan lipid II flippase [Agromyces flavus]|uniref:Peptidoglycan lipid II flippase n=1 Tax=Agromyces flavus TaxID=589382 RepID=A0A1H1YXG5_9MICO|nr:murein biosynthesis integral membrane protein MurJ [Agromyces flavus]MCP2366842.1 putative peptidoglycan lipid II flippase [Agromyces flavus]GGI46915.1 lipid II flippase MurJ [Agromyces flavus]SDT26037.1 putative peptidoglycan lipid II flippase [Agromyces flavus]